MQNFLQNVKRLFVILSITCVAFLNLNAISSTYGDDKNKRGDDKKNKAKREDTTKFIVNNENLIDSEDESPDTNQILFPSHDLYATWDTLSAHPYNFSEAFKMDSVVIQLTNQGDCLLYTSDAADD